MCGNIESCFRICDSVAVLIVMRSVVGLGIGIHVKCVYMDV